MQQSCTLGHHSSSLAGSQSGSHSPRPQPGVWGPPAACPQSPRQESCTNPAPWVSGCRGRREATAEARADWVLESGSGRDSKNIEADSTLYCLSRLIAWALCTVDLSGEWGVNWQCSG